MRINRKFKLISLLCFISTIALLSNNFCKQASESEYDGLEFTVKDQLIVDDQVMVTVNIHHQKLLFLV